MPDASATDSGFDGGAVDAGPVVTQIAAGASSACAVLSDGALRCWGSNDAGQLGDGTENEARVPVAVQGITNARQVSVGYQHACALRLDGTVACWGANDTGELGNSTKVLSKTPVAVSGIANAVWVSVGAQTPQVGAGRLAHSCAVLAGGAVKCWGDSTWCELGNGQRVCGGGCGCQNTQVPVAVQGVSAAVEVAASGANTCALLSDAGVYCWGDDNQNEITGSMTLDAGATALVSSPTGDSFMVLLTDGRIAGWAHDTDGQLGDGTSGVGNDRAAVVYAAGVHTAVSMAVEGLTNDFRPGHACAALGDGTVQCWGDNTFGQLGNGSTTSSLSPVTVQGISNAVAVAVGSGAQSVNTSYGFSCALLSDGTVRCWGYGVDGQLGDGLGISSSIPVPVQGLP